MTQLRRIPPLGLPVPLVAIPDRGIDRMSGIGPQWRLVASRSAYGSWHYHGGEWAPALTAAVWRGIQHGDVLGVTHRSEDGSCDWFLKLSEAAR